MKKISTEIFCSTILKIRFIFLLLRRQKLPHRMTLLHRTRTNLRKMFRRAGLSDVEGHNRMDRPSTPPIRWRWRARGRTICSFHSWDCTASTRVRALQAVRRRGRRERPSTERTWRRSPAPADQSVWNFSREGPPNPKLAASRNPNTFQAWRNNLLLFQTTQKRETPMRESSWVFWRREEGTCTQRCESPGAFRRETASVFPPSPMLRCGWKRSHSRTGRKRQDKRSTSPIRWTTRALQTNKSLPAPMSTSVLASRETPLVKFFEFLT